MRLPNVRLRPTPLHLAASWTGFWGGKLPSGYPPPVEKSLPSLLHDYPYRRARRPSAYPSISFRSRNPVFRLLDLAGRSPLRTRIVRTNVCLSTTSSHFHALSNRYLILSLGIAHTSLASPGGYLRTIFDADPKHTIVVPAPPDLKGFVPGDRLFIDTSLRLSSADVYVTLERKGPRLVVYDGRRFDQRRLLEHPPRNVAILGRLVAVFGHARLGRV